MCGVLDHREFTLDELRKAVKEAGLDGYFTGRQVDDQVDENMLKHDMLQSLTKRTEADILREAVRARIKGATRQPVVHVAAFVDEPRQLPQARRDAFADELESQQHRATALLDFA